MPTGDLLFAHFPPLLFLPRKEQSWQWSRARFVRSALPPPPLPSTTERGKIKIHRRLVTFSPTARSWESLLTRVLSILDIPLRGCENLTPTAGVGFTKPLPNLSNFSRLSRALLLSFSGCLVSSDKAFHPYSWQRNLGMERCSFPRFLLLIHHISLPESFCCIFEKMSDCAIEQSAKQIHTIDPNPTRRCQHVKSRNMSKHQLWKCFLHSRTFLPKRLNNWTRRISLSIRLWGLLISVAVVFSLLIY